MVAVVKFGDTPKVLEEINLGEFIDSAILQWSIIGSVGAIGTSIDGVRIVPFDCDISAVYASLAERGNNGNTIIDINVGSPNIPLAGDVDTAVTLSTIYATQANRPTLAGNNGASNDNIVLHALLPNTISLTKGQILSFDVDTKVSSSRDLTVLLFIKKP